MATRQLNRPPVKIPEALRQDPQVHAFLKELTLSLYQLWENQTQVPANTIKGNNTTEQGRASDLTPAEILTLLGL